MSKTQIRVMTMIGHWKKRAALALVLGLAALLSGLTQAGVTYYHNDLLGSPIAATNEDGDLLWTREYEPYGEVVDKASFDQHRTGYTGHQYDSETGITYAGARYYNQQLGRFLSPDPVSALSATEANPMMFNRYGYGNNNPYRYVDPDGAFPILPILFVIAGEALGIAIDVATMTPTQDEINPAMAGIPGLPAGKAGALIKAGSKYSDEAAQTAANSVPRLSSLGSVVNRSMDFAQGQLQHAFKHAKDFGITGTWNKANGMAFQKAIQSHVDDAATEIIQGTYRGKPANHFYNPNTGLNVIRDENMNFLSGWKLSNQQRHYVTTTGNLGGG